ncbi:5,10-methylenetetrahydrofolate dehydrogenase [Chloropicon primus]|uniref:methenyltetrahydrofolate cyclohydrolase n=2 Tax=Chloropicon primus TaxID=1764295 RepID=A0A5B8MDW5_9CHLO|nr:5,10-methylenetetrahydrofolate dehydrogenase [Chloropicon primus]UPQ97796.1 5,10-methylenetetrahydrofolate dehydrogenase [Chloropicon primus]|eukprot:QDZ18587.1 5,10-methylenetetrahydrofolate dehydrogenase [Chloropicon primus]
MATQWLVRTRGLGLAVWSGKSALWSQQWAATTANAVGSGERVSLNLLRQAVVRPFATKEEEAQSTEAREGQAGFVHRYKGLRGKRPAGARRGMKTETRGRADGVLDGRRVAQQWLSEIGEEVAELRGQGRRPPGLAVVLVGNRPDSVLYINRKRQAAADVGIDFNLIELPEKVTQERLLERLDDLFLDERVDGVIVQLPLPRHIDEEAVLERIDPEKDVDGFHPLNVGRLAMRGVHPSFVPCTPRGAVELLTRYGIELAGKKAVVLGNSNTVGMPLSMLLRDEGCVSVTVCHCTAWDFVSQNQEHRRACSNLRAAAEACLPPLQAGGGASGGGKRHLPATCVGAIPDVTKTADVLFVAIGYPELVKRSWVKEGCIVVDIGINARPTNEQDCIQEISKQLLAEGCLPTPCEVEIVGDVDFEEVSQVASWITPVPGGSGPMTIAALMSNVVASYRELV